MHVYLQDCIKHERIRSVQTNTRATANQTGCVLRMCVRTYWTDILHPPKEEGHCKIRAKPCHQHSQRAGLVNSLPAEDCSAYDRWSTKKRKRDNRRSLLIHLSFVGPTEWQNRGNRGSHFTQRVESQLSIVVLRNEKKKHIKHQLSWTCDEICGSSCLLTKRNHPHSMLKYRD